MKHPPSNGQTEWANEIVEDMLREYVITKPTKSDQYLPISEFAYNSSKHTSMCAYSSYVDTIWFSATRPNQCKHSPWWAKKYTKFCKGYARQVAYRSG